MMVRQLAGRTLGLVVADCNLLGVPVVAGSQPEVEGSQTEVEGSQTEGEDSRLVEDSLTEGEGNQIGRAHV